MSVGIIDLKTASLSLSLFNNNAHYFHIKFGVVLRYYSLKGRMTREISIEAHYNIKPFK